MGGTGALVNGLKKLMIEEKIVIKKNSEVTKILTEKNKVIGVEINQNKKLFADKIIINADPTYTYKHLLKTPYNKKWNNKRVDKLDYSMGLFVIFFGTKKYIKKSLIIQFGWENDMKVYWMIFLKKILADDFSLYLHRPTATDKSMAPKGCDSFYVLSQYQISKEI